jgi:hypothetical protein
MGFFERPIFLGFGANRSIKGGSPIKIASISRGKVYMSVS